MRNALKLLFVTILCSFGIAANASPVYCTIQSFDGHYLTAVGGGGRATDVIHTDANRVGAWEKFQFVKYGNNPNDMRHAIRTIKGFYLTAVGGGGRATDAIQSNRTQVKAWEVFTLVQLANRTFAIRTMTGNYLTAQDSGGRITDVIHSNATRASSWEQFRINCGI